MHDVVTLKDRYLGAVLSGERREALRLVIDEGVARGMSPEVVRRDVIQAAQLEIGARWQRNEISVADEHMATAIAQLALAHLFNHTKPAPANGKSALVACVPGELHDFPARLAADALDLAGFNVRFLGADVPENALVGAATSKRPDIIALSVTITFNIPGLKAAIAALRASSVADIPVVIGGNACKLDGLARELHADAQAADADELVTIAKRLTGLAA